MLLTWPSGDDPVDSAIDRFVFFFALLHAAVLLPNMVWIQSVTWGSTPCLGLEGFGISPGCISPLQSIGTLAEDSNIGNRTWLNLLRTSRLRPWWNYRKRWYFIFPPILMLRWWSHPRSSLVDLLDWSRGKEIFGEGSCISSTNNSIVHRSLAQIVGSFYGSTSSSSCKTKTW